MTSLSVNVDHVATLRQARGVGYPDPVEAAERARAAGAAGITVHLRGDRRHIQDDDVHRLRRQVDGKLNLELATTEEMLAIALEIVPDQVTLVPERQEEITTEGGLDLVGRADEIARAADRLVEGGIAVSLFLDPDRQQIDRLADLPDDLVTSFELNTDAYTRADDERQAAELDELRAAAARGAELGFEIYAGHGLTTANVGAVASIEVVRELNIGHAIVSRAVLVGIGEAVREMLVAMGELG